MIILDLLVVAVAVQIIAGGDDDDLEKPAIIAVLASIAVSTTNFLSYLYADSLLVFLGCMAVIAGIVAAATKLFMTATRKQSLLLGVVFLVYKVLNSILFFAVFSSGS